MEVGGGTDDERYIEEEEDRALQVEKDFLKEEKSEESEEESEESEEESEVSKEEDKELGVLITGVWPPRWVEGEYRWLEGLFYFPILFGDFGDRETCSK